MILPLQFFSQISGGYLSASVGYSLPRATYAGTSAHYATGFAKPGPSYTLNFVYKPQRYFAGLAILIRNQTNPVDVQTMEKRYAAANPNSSDWNIQSKPWSVNLFMLGGYSPFTIRNGDVFCFHIKYMFGAAYSIMPQLDATYRQNAQTYSSRAISASKLSATYLLGFGMSYNVNSKITMAADIDYFGTKAEFLIGEMMFGGPSVVSPITHIYSQTITSINITLGIGFRLK
ncbi:MAG: hypothetical protein ACXVC6_04120 [Bacteroidia bacterium]